jgi:histidinol dehydrogenase
MWAGVGLHNPSHATAFEVTMPIKIDQRDKGFEAAFTAFLSTKRESAADVDETVREIINAVRVHGDKAVLDYTKKFDRLDLKADKLRITDEEIKAAYSAAPKATIEALRLAKSRIENHHLRQVPKDDRYTDSIGVELGSRWTAVESVGLYVPGGTASYPSSVLMNAVPAKVAGVERVVMVVPSPDGILNPLVLVAADIAGVSEIYRIGGAQAVAALAYGTKTIAPVVKIVGPGNAYVAAAKRQVFGKVGIDMIAGPEALLPKIRNAGAIFLGAYTPEVIGDYVAGSNHILPTARTSRFSSGLSVLDFVKRTSVLKLGPEQLQALAPAAMELAKAEGLGAHKRSISIRLNGYGRNE